MTSKFTIPPIRGATFRYLRVNVMIAAMTDTYENRKL